MQHTSPMVLESAAQALSSRPTLYLHVGTHKTATTTLQSWLYGHRAWLAERGVIMPTEGPYYRFGGVPPLTGGHCSLAHAMMGTCPHWVEPAQMTSLGECITVLKGHLRAWREARGGARADVILTSEDWIRGVPAAQLASLAEALDCRPVVLVYLRRQDEFLESLYNQWVKTGRERRGVEEFVASQLADSQSYGHYRTLLEPFVAVFGASAVLVRPFEEEQLVGGNVVFDVLQLLGVAPPAKRSISRENASTPTELLEVVRRLVSALPDDTPLRARADLARAIRRVGLPHVDPRRYSLLTERLRERVVAHYEPTNQWVARHLLGRGDEQLFRAPAPSYAPWSGLQPRVIERVSAALLIESTGRPA